MIKKENIAIAVIGTVVIFVFILLVNIGSFFDPEGKRFLPEVSFLISPYISGRSITVPLFLAFNFLLLLFSFGLFVRIRSSFAKIGSESLAAAALTGFLLLLFPMDDPGAAQTVMGIWHNAFVLLLSLFIVLALSLFGIAFYKMANLAWLSRYSFSISLLLFFASTITGYFAFFNNKLVGLVERLPISAFLLWILLVVIGILKSDRRVKYH